MVWILVFIVLPLVEIVLLVKLGTVIGWPVTVLLCILTGILGATLTRVSGVRILQQIQAELVQGRAPTREIVEGLLILVAGVVLLTPGIITDVAGFLVLTPPIRRVLAASLARRFAARGSIRFGGFGASGGMGRPGSSPGSAGPFAGSDPGAEPPTGRRFGGADRGFRSTREETVTDAEFEYGEEREDR